MKKKKTLIGGKEFKLNPYRDLFMSTFYIEYEPNRYFPADLTYISLLKVNQSISDVDNKYYNIESKNYYKVISDIKRNTVNPIIGGFFKNYAQNKYYKMLKRLRTIITRELFNNKDKYNNVEQRNMFQIRQDILEIYNSELGTYSQINKRIDTAIELIDKVEPDKIMIFILEIFDDFLLIKYEHELMNDILVGNDIKKNLKKIKKDLFEKLNNKAKPLLKEYYKKCQPFLPFEVKIN